MGPTIDSITGANGLILKISATANKELIPDHFVYIINFLQTNNCTNLKKQILHFIQIYSMDLCYEKVHMQLK